MNFFMTCFTNGNSIIDVKPFRFIFGKMNYMMCYQITTNTIPTILTRISIAVKNRLTPLLIFLRCSIQYTLGRHSAFPVVIIASRWFSLWGSSSPYDGITLIKNSKNMCLRNIQFFRYFFCTFTRFVEYFYLTVINFPKLAKSFVNIFSFRKCNISLERSPRAFCLTINIFKRHIFYIQIVKNIKYSHNSMITQMANYG